MVVIFFICLIGNQVFFLNNSIYKEICASEVKNFDSETEK